MSDRIIYVLCYDDITEQKAHEEFDKFDWARIYRIPEESQNHLFEGVMYQTELMKVYDEWKDKKYVGTCAYSMFKKINEKFINCTDNPNQEILNRITTDKSYDFVGFYPTQAKYAWDHRYLYTIVNDLLRGRARLNNQYKFYFFITIHNFYPFNYWMATPANMLEYIHYFNNKWLPALESHPLVWSSAEYMGKLSSERLLYLTRGRCDHYPYHPFVNERLPSIYFEKIKANMLI
jgi:hypothetical protein